MCTQHNQLSRNVEPIRIFAEILLYHKVAIVEPICGWAKPSREQIGIEPAIWRPLPIDSEPKGLPFLNYQPNYKTNTSNIGTAIHLLYTDLGWYSFGFTQE